MQLKTFEARRYRSLVSSQKLSFSKKLILIGKNNEGKTNLLKALDTAMQILRSMGSESVENKLVRVPTPTRGGARAYVWERDFPIPNQGGKGKKETIFKLDFELTELENNELKSLIGSRLNGNLPLEISICEDNRPKIRTLKTGKGASSLNKKSGLIARFVADKLHFNYIPAVRTDSSTVDLIQDMLDKELYALEKKKEYKDALDVITELQKPILEKLALQVETPLREFMPDLNSVQLEVSESSRRYLLRRSVNVIVDDGVPTKIEFKGEGIKSLAALALLKNMTPEGGATILAIEEPESHLHPGAIHQVNEIINSISEKSQVIISTHNPLFVDRQNIKCNIIVSNGSATPAKDIKFLRDTLGIKASDNLTHANYALVVEGVEDQIALKALLPLASEKLAKALKSNTLVIECLDGGSNLSYKLSTLRNHLCSYHVLLDNDEAGRSAYEKAKTSSLIKVSEITFVMCQGFSESEFEDLIDTSIYRDIFLAELGVDISSSKFRGGKKWSARLKDCLVDHGKPTDNATITKAKYLLAEAVTKDPHNALIERKRTIFDAMVRSLEALLP